MKNQNDLKSYLPEGNKTFISIMLIIGVIASIASSWSRAISVGSPILFLLHIALGVMLGWHMRDRSTKPHTNSQSTMRLCLFVAIIMPHIHRLHIGLTVYALTLVILMSITFIIALKNTDKGAALFIKNYINLSLPIVVLLIEKLIGSPAYISATPYPAIAMIIGIALGFICVAYNAKEDIPLVEE